MLSELMSHPDVEDIQGIAPQGLLSKTQLQLFMRRLQAGQPISKLSKTHQLCARLPASSLILKTLSILQALRFRRHLAHWVYWEPGFALLPLASPAVATLYDLSHLRQPEHHPWLRVKLLNTFMPRTLARAKRLITISSFTHSELCTLLSPSQPIDIAYPGVDHAFFNVTAEETEQCRQKLNLPEHFILSVATLEPRKNLTGLISAFSALPQSIRMQYPLVIAGARGWRDSSINKAIQSLVDQGEAKVLGYVDQDDMPALYAAATVTAYLSLYEGFGMPAAESMATGTAVLTSNCSSLPEVVADGAVTVHPLDTRATTEALEALLSNERLRLDVISKGRARAQAFCWPKSAKILVSSLKKALQNTQPD